MTIRSGIDCCKHFLCKFISYYLSMYNFLYVSLKLCTPHPTPSVQIPIICIRNMKIISLLHLLETGSDNTSNSLFHRIDLPSLLTR